MNDLKKALELIAKDKVSKRQSGRNPKGKQQTPAKKQGGQLANSGKRMVLATSSPVVNEMFQRSTMNKTSLYKGIKFNGLTQAGVDFLKAAFAAPDFANQGAFLGIPDAAFYKVLPYRHLFTADLFSLGVPRPDGSNRTVLVQLPTPGIAFWWCKIGSDGIQPDTVLYPQRYYDIDSLYGIDWGANQPENASKIVTEFRMVSNCLELICTSNATSWDGSLRCHKMTTNIEEGAFYETGSGGPILTKRISGLLGIGAYSIASFITPSNLGVYMTSQNKGKDFKTSPMLDGIRNINKGLSAALAEPTLFGNLFGYGDLECNVVVLENTGNTNFSIRTWQIMEYTPREGDSIVYNTSHGSPTSDAVALRAYKSMVEQLPLAVTFFENDDYWSSRVAPALGM